MIAAFVVGIFCGTLLAIGLFVWWIGQHNDLGTVSVYEDEPSDQFVAPEMNLDGPPRQLTGTMDEALGNSAQTRARVERGWGELRDDGTVVIHTAMFTASEGGKLVNSEPIQVRLHTAHDAAMPDEQEEYAAAAYARQGASWPATSESAGFAFIEPTPKVTAAWLMSAVPSPLDDEEDDDELEGEPVDKEFYTAAEYVEYWRQQELDPWDVAIYQRTHRDARIDLYPSLRTER